MTIVLFMIRKACSVGAIFLFCAVLQAGEDPIHPQILRVMKLSAAKPGWENTKTLSDKMWVVRKEIIPLGTASDPVSDRYLITKLGGPIDWVHFLALSAQVCSGTHTLEDALYAQWKSEGGQDHEKGLSRVYYPEAHPDDLPSNAFGALLGMEVRHLQNNPDADLARILHEFVKPLLPISDEVAKRYSHQYIVMGLPEKPDRDTLLSRSEWFTATPLYMLSALDPGLKQKAPNSRMSLQLAGFEVYPIKGKPIGIRRIRK